MTKQFYILIFIAALGFLMPSLTYACGTTSEKSCCKKESSEKSEKKDCCKKDNHSKNKKKGGCDGKCNHNSCNCSTINFSTYLTVVSELKNQNFTCSTQQKFYNIDPSLSSGFYSVWLLPKIS